MSSSSSFVSPSFNPLPLVVAIASVFGAAAAHADSFAITGSSTTAQSLAKNQTGSVAVGGSLTVGGGSNAVTVTGNGVTITNLGSMITTGTSSGRVIRDNTGVTSLVVNNGSASNSSALMQSADNDVIQMNKASASVTLNNWGSMISLNASSGGAQVVDFNAITTGANIVNNYSTGVIQATEADAVRTGVNGVVNNYGKIKSTTTTGSSSDGVDMQNNSGATINNFAGGLIEGGRHGITGGALNATTTFNSVINNYAGGTIQGDNGSGINIDGFNALEVVTVVNGGTITGNGITGDGDGVDVDGVVNITNTGLIQSLNAYTAPGTGTAFSEGVTVGGGTITNSGTIQGLNQNNNANTLGIGITLTGNDITTGVNAGNRDGLYANAVVNNLAGGVIYGSNSSAIVAKGLASGYTVTIGNAAGGTIRGGGTTDAAIQLGLDSSTINNSGAIDGSSSGKAIDFGTGTGTHTLNVIGGAASIQGSINGSVNGTNTMTFAIGSGNNFAYSGSISNFQTVNVQSGTTTLSGQNTYTGTTVLSGGTLQLSGANVLSAASSLDLEGGTLKLVGTGSDQTFASLSLGASSSLVLGSNSLTFASLGSIASGVTLTVTGNSFSLVGDYSNNAAFKTLVSETTIDGKALSVTYNGTLTTVSAVPEPSSLAMLLAGMGLVGFVGMRRRKV